MANKYLSEEEKKLFEETLHKTINEEELKHLEKILPSWFKVRSNKLHLFNIEHSINIKQKVNEINNFYNSLHEDKKQLLENTTVELENTKKEYYDGIINTYEKKDSLIDEIGEKLSIYLNNKNIKKIIKNITEIFFLHTNAGRAIGHNKINIQKSFFDNDLIEYFKLFIIFPEENKSKFEERLKNLSGIYDMGKEAYGLYNLEKENFFIYNNRIKIFLEKLYDLKNIQSLDKLSIYYKDFKIRYLDYCSQNLCFAEVNKTINNQIELNEDQLLNFTLNIEFDSFIWNYVEIIKEKEKQQKELKEIKNLIEEGRRNDYQINRKNENYEFEGKYYEKLMGNSDFYIFKGIGDLRDLAEISESSEFYQREKDENHKNELKEYIEKSNFKFMPEIILSLKENSETYNIDKKNDKLIIKTKNLETNNEKLFRIDGNHRLSAALEADINKTDRRYLQSQFYFIIFSEDIGEERRREIEANIFYLINDKQKKITSEEALKVILGYTSIEGNEELELIKEAYVTFKDNRNLTCEIFEKKVLTKIKYVVNFIRKNNIANKEKEIKELFELIIEIPTFNKELQKREDYFLNCCQIYLDLIKDKIDDFGEQKERLRKELENLFLWITELKVNEYNGDIIEENLESPFLWKTYKFSKLRIENGENLIQQFEDESHFYKELINEINSTYKCKHYTSCMILCRKLFENKIIGILRNKFISSTDMNLYYNNGRFNDFSVLLDNLNNKKNDFGPYKDLVEKIYNKLKTTFIKSANRDAHSIIEIPNQQEIDNLKINEIYQLIKTFNT